MDAANSGREFKECRTGNIGFAGHTGNGHMSGGVGIGERNEQKDRNFKGNTRRAPRDKKEHGAHKKGDDRTYLHSLV